MYVYTYICIEIFSLSLLFNFAVEEHPWLGNKFQRPHLYDIAYEYPALKINIIEDGRTNISYQKYHRDS